MDDTSLAEHSSLLTAKPLTASSVSSTAKLLRKNSHGNTTSKPALEDNNNKARRKSRENAIIKSKYANMSLEQALALACPTLQTLDGVSLAKKRALEAKKNEDGDGGFHTW